LSVDRWFGKTSTSFELTLNRGSCICIFISIPVLGDVSSLIWFSKASIWKWVELYRFYDSIPEAYRFADTTLFLRSLNKIYSSLA
jgi:hypothetical protein